MNSVETTILAFIYIIILYNGVNKVLADNITNCIKNLKEGLGEKTDVLEVLRYLFDNLLEGRNTLEMDNKTELGLYLLDIKSNLFFNDIPTIPTFCGNVFGKTEKSKTNCIKSIINKLTVNAETTVYNICMIFLNRYSATFFPESDPVYIYRTAVINGATTFNAVQNLMSVEVFCRVLNLDNGHNLVGFKRNRKYRMKPDDSIEELNAVTRIPKPGSSNKRNNDNNYKDDNPQKQLRMG